MDRRGAWRLSPAFDVVWAYNPTGDWTNRHQMSVNGKRDRFARADLLAVADQFGIKNAREILAEVGAAVARWGELAKLADVSPALRDSVGKTHRLHLLKKA
jgi:serine/threonine-protein kinase HipA